MGESAELTRLESHFAFGENWAAYAEKVGEAEIAEAVRELHQLLGKRLDGKRFLDIGSGSGLHSLAALRLGAAEVISIDIDPHSVATSRTVLTRHAAGLPFLVEEASVFDLSPQAWGHFDVVYSWGVLHHSGDMYRAIRNAATLVAPGGRFAFALYRKTWLCGFWRWEKRRYARASRQVQAAARALYVGLFAFGLLLTGRRFKTYVRHYRSSRGMDYHNDVHDWLGGYPYESVSPADVERFMSNMRFRPERVLARNGTLFGRDIGILASGCDEYVYVRCDP